MPGTSTIKRTLATWVVASLIPMAADAGPVTLGGPLPAFRQATLDSALPGGFVGSGNATASIINGYYGGTWTQVGSCEAADPCVNGVLTVAFTEGGWNSNATRGTWTISSAFLFKDLVISMHVGNGQGEPDHFVWKIAEDGVPGPPYAGTWSYTRGGTGGGGFSNIKAYGRDAITSVPDGGTTLALMGSVLMGLGLLRRMSGW